MSDDFKFGELNATHFESPFEREVRSAFGALEDMHLADIADFVADGVVAMQRLSLIPDTLESSDEHSAHTELLKLKMCQNLGLKTDVSPEPGHDIEWEPYSNVTVRLTVIDRDKDPVHVMTHYDTSSGNIAEVWLLNNESATREIDEINNKRRMYRIHTQLMDLSVPNSVINGDLTLDEKQQIINDFDFIKQILTVPAIDKSTLAEHRKKVVKTMIPYIATRGKQARFKQKKDSYVEFIDKSIKTNDVDTETVNELLRSERQQRLLELDIRLNRKKFLRNVGNTSVHFAAYSAATGLSALAGRIIETSSKLPIDTLQAAAIGSASMGILCLQSLTRCAKRMSRVRGFSSVNSAPRLSEQLDQEAKIAKSDLDMMRF